MSGNNKPHRFHRVNKMKRILFLASLFFIILSSVGLAYPPVYLKKLSGTPDLCQADKSARLPKGGKGYCAPVAVSNSLVWLARNGYLCLIPKTGSKRMTQPQLATLLGEARFMDTSDNMGTSPTDLLQGVKHFLDQQECAFDSLLYQGWRTHPAEFSGKSEIPDIGWIKEGLVGDTAVWLNIGWYAYDPMTETYERTGGHWVTLVGYGMDRKRQENPDILIIHDPATRVLRRVPRPGNAPAKPAATLAAQAATAQAEAAPATKAVRTPAPVRHDFVKLAPMTGGTLKSRDPNINRSALGCYRITGITSLEKEADIAILDGAVVLKMKKQEASGEKAESDQGKTGAVAR